MTWTVEQDAIAARFAAQSPVGASLIAWDDFNMPPFTPPTVNSASPSAAIWVRPTVRPVPMSGRPISLGVDAPHVREGMILVQCFAPAGYGETELSDVVDDVRGIYHRASFNSVRCRDTDAPNRIGLRDEWWQVNVITPYWIEETGPTTTGVVEDASVQEFTQASHGLSVLNVVYRTSTTTWAKARANASGTLGQGIVTRVSGDTFTVATIGFQSIATNAGTVGAKFYTSQATAGLLTQTAPDPTLGGFSQEMATLITSTLLLVHPMPGQEY